MLFAVENLNLIYRSQTGESVALKDVSFNVEKNSLCAIFGPSGSGKSSLLYVMSGLREPTSGKIIYKDKDLLKLGENEKILLRKAQFSFIFQQFYLIPWLNVLENILIAQNISASGRDKDNTVEVLEKLELRDKIKRFPYELSVGEKQRVAVARAVSTSAEVVFADEPTASLNTELGLKVVDILSSYKKKGAVLLITHDPRMIEGADKTINLRDGKINIGTLPLFS